MKEHIVVIFFMVMSGVWGMVVNDKWRRVFMPWCLAVLLMNLSCGAFYVGPLRVVYALSNYSIFVILCDGFGFGKRGHNPVWKLFMVFWAYMFLACFWGYYAIEGVFLWIKVLFTSFCCGYYFSRWAIQSEGAMRRTSLAFAVTGAITLFLYWRHGGIAVMDESMGGRAALDAETLAEGVKSNANYTAGALSNLMMFLLFAIIRPVRSREDVWLKWISAAELAIAGIMMIRCGSRGAVIGLLPALWFVVSSGKGRLKRKVRIGVLVAAGIVLSIGVYFVKGNVGELRAFRIYSDDTSSYYDSSMDRLTTGRSSMWKWHLSMMTPIDYMIGQGFTKESMVASERTERLRLTIGNAHSMYMTVFYHAGTIGVFIFLFYILGCLRRGMKMGLRGRVALVFFGAWMLMGIGESAGMTGTFMGVIGGIGCGLLTQGPAANSEFGERQLVWYGR